MTIYSKMRISNPSPYFETPAEVLRDHNLSRHEKEKVLRSMALDEDQMLEATAEGMPWGSPAYNAKDLQAALNQLEDIKDPGDVDAQISPNARFKQIVVVTTADQEINRTVADMAHNMAEAADGKVYFLSVVPSDFEGAGLAAAGPMVTSVPLVETDDRHMLEDRTAQLETLKAEFDFSAEPEIEVHRGQIEQVIVEYADNCDADVIVVGSPNRSWLNALLDTSVSRKVTKFARCPVLVVPEAP
jgi:nucleotide-binding universal stress UspA family protein